MTRVDVIIVNYNAGDYLGACLDGLKAQSIPNFKAFIVDNASQDGSLEALCDLDDRFTIVRNDDNMGFAAACNQGAALGQAKWIAMLNPDATPEPDWLEQAIVCGESTGAAAIGSTQISTNNPDVLDGAGDVYAAYGVAWRGGFEQSLDHIPPTGYCFSPCAAASVYRREAFEAVGGFDERFFCYMEDVDIAYRLRLRGEQNIQCREACVTHVGSATSGRASPFVIYHGTRNRIWTFLKNTPPVLFWLMLPLHALVNLAFLVRGRFHNRFDETWSGTRDGIAGWSWIRAERRELAKTRKAGSWTLAKAMTWSPIKLIRRAPDVRPLKTNQTLK